MSPYIEAVCVCVNYSDFLAASLPFNLPLFDDIVIVTTPEDDATIRLCKRWGVRYVTTHVFTRDGSVFNKSRGINHGLNHLRRRDWLIHLDADTVLPPRFRHMLANAELDESSIYGVDRVNCPSYEEWAAFLANPEVQYEWQYLVKPPRGWRLGARLAHWDYGGYCPIGFFQMWHASSGVIRYPILDNGTAEHSDVLHAAQWDRPKRVLLPEVIAVHLESEPAKMGINWSGRKTRSFGPSRLATPEATAAPAMPARTYDGTANP